MKRHPIIRHSLCLITLLFSLLACDNSTIYYSFQSVPIMGWSKKDTLRYNVPITDSLRILDITAEVRNEDNYPYRELYLIVSHNLEDSTKWESDTLKFTLTNASGRWNGKGWNLYESKPIALKQAANRHPGHFMFKVIHAMKDNQLKGISDVGIHIRDDASFRHQSEER